MNINDQHEDWEDKTKREPSAFKAIRIPYHVFFGGGGGDDPKETGEYRTALMIADDRYSKYQDIFVPAENYAIKESLNYDNANRSEQLSGQSSNAVQGAFSQAIDTELSNLTSGGVNPNSGKFNSAINTGSTSEGIAIADNVNRTQTALQDQADSAVENVIALGSNQETTALAGLNQTALASTRDANQRAARDYQKDQNTSQAIGKVGGIAADATINRT